jgi:hypothetical protein
VAYANGDSESVAYSFIGNCHESGCGPTNTAGSYHDRLTCSSSNNSDCLSYPFGATAGYTLDNTAPPGSTPDHIGNLSGALVRDNNGIGYWTYTSTTPRISFSITSNPSSLTNSIIFVTGADPTNNDGQTVYWTDYPTPVNTKWESDSQSLNTGAQAGFHLLAIDASPWSGTPNVILDKTYTFLYDSSFAGRNLQDLPGDIINNCSSRRCLFFLSTIGMITDDLRTRKYANGPLTVNDMLDDIAMAIRSIGGDYRTFQQLGRKPFTTPAPHTGASAEPDDYVLIGQHAQSSRGLVGVSVIPSSTAEFSSFISRQIYQHPPLINKQVVSNVAGYLKLDHEGYYEPYNATLYSGFSDPVVDAFASAGVQPNGYWPLSGPTDSTPQLAAAYAYLSRKADSGSDGDLRSQYGEFPSTESNWLPFLLAATYTANPNFSASDFKAMQTELVGEVTAVNALDNFKTAELNFFSTSASLKLGYTWAITDQVKSDLQIDLTKKISIPSWLGVFNDVVAVAGPISDAASIVPGGSPVGVAAQTGIAVLALVVDKNAESSNDPHGTPLQATEKLEVAASELADTLSNDLNAYTTGLNTLIQRIAWDPNRLNHFYAAELLLAAGQADPTNPQAFNLDVDYYGLASDRQAYTRLIASTYQILHFEYNGPNSNPDDAISYYHIYIDHRVDRFNGDKCTVNGTIAGAVNTTAFLPGTLIDGPDSAGYPYSRKDIYPHDLWWDFWGIGISGNLHTGCPRVDDYQDIEQQFKNYGLFAPLQPSQTGGVFSPLGMYRTYFLNPDRTGIPLITGNTADPYWSCAYCTDLYAPQPPHVYPQNLDTIW